MSNASGIIYIDNTVTPNIGVSIYDIQSVLGVASYNDIGGLIVNGGVKKWAKYKPVVFGSLGTTDQLDTDKTWKSTANWWKATDGFCGFLVPSYSSGADLDGETDEWVYVRPNGTIATQPFRVLDFNRYDHNSVIPFSLQMPEYVVIGMATEVKLSLSSNLASGNLSLADIGPFADYYFGVAVFRDNQTPTFVTCADKISEESLHSINIEDFDQLETEGTARIYAFLGQTAQTTPGSQYEHTLYFLNTDEEVGFRVVNVFARADNVYRIAFNGLATPNDTKALGQPTIHTSGGVFYATMSIVRQFSKNYTLVSVLASAKLHSTGTVVDSQYATLASCEVSYLDKTDIVGTTYNFHAPIPGLSLPPIIDPSDYYEITFTYTYE